MQLTVGPAGGEVSRELEMDLKFRRKVWHRIANLGVTDSLGAKALSCESG